MSSKRHHDPSTGPARDDTDDAEDPFGDERVTSVIDAAWDDLTS